MLLPNGKLLIPCDDRNLVFDVSDIDLSLDMTEYGMRMTCNVSRSNKNIFEFEPTRILRNGKATIVFWDDGTKTIVKCEDGDRQDPYTAFTAALAKKIYGSNSRVKKIVNKTEEQKRKK